jgi:pantoate--beta-alanine ligase
MLSIARTAYDLRDYLGKYPKSSVGFVPTMGALHKGHLTLIQKAKEHCDIVVASIFVNPLQFNDIKDYQAYPITIERDTILLNSVGCDLLFLPDYDTIYPPNHSPVNVSLHPIDGVFEGSYRPGHFDGVVQVLYRFFLLVQPDRAFFGLKDYQQCLVVSKLTDAFFPKLQLEFVDTIRETSGLAMSSRNERLSSEGKKKAAQLYQVLHDMRQKAPHVSPKELTENGKLILEQKGFQVEYLNIATLNELTEIKFWESGKNVIILAAVYVEGIRLIDNLIISL